jgi:hypothetical protein
MIFISKVAIGGSRETTASILSIEFNAFSTDERQPLQVIPVIV